MGKRIKTIILVIIAIAILVFACMKISQYIKKQKIAESNKIYVEKYVDANYPNFTITSKRYMYLDHFWSTYYDTKEDSIEKDILCYATLKNKKNDMIVTVPFYHPKDGEYTDTPGKKNIKGLFKEYEKYWEEINKIKEENNIELKVSNVRINETDQYDIGNIIIYLKEDEKVDEEKIISDIMNIKTSLHIDEIEFIVAKEKAYEEFIPWTESNSLITAIHNGNFEKTEETEDYDVYVQDFEKRQNDWDKEITVYYKYK